MECAGDAISEGGRLVRWRNQTIKLRPALASEIRPDLILSERRFGAHWPELNVSVFCAASQFPPDADPEARSIRQRLRWGAVIGRAILRKSGL